MEMERSRFAEPEKLDKSLTIDARVKFVGTFVKDKNAPNAACMLYGRLKYTRRVGINRFSDVDRNQEQHLEETRSLYIKARTDPVCIYMITAAVEIMHDALVLYIAEHRQVGSAERGQPCKIDHPAVIPAMPSVIAYAS